MEVNDKAKGKIAKKVIRDCQKKLEFVFFLFVSSNI